MKKILFQNKILFCLGALLFILCLSFPVSYGQADKEKETFYSLNVDKLSKNIFASCELFEEGKELYNKQDYVNARLKFQEALSKDPGNKKASKYFALCNQKFTCKDMTSAKKMKKKKMEEENRLLNNLIQRVEKLEREESKKIAIPPKKELSVQEKAGQIITGSCHIGEVTTTSLQKQDSFEDTPQLISEHKIKQAEFLLHQGNKYYDNLDYEKAYKLYKEALEALEPSD